MYQQIEVDGIYHQPKQPDEEDDGTIQENRTESPY